jgi:prevent-host-death family protein
MSKPLTAQRKISSIASSTLQQKIGSVLRRVAVDGEHILVERNGYPTAVIIPVNDYKMLSQLHDKQQSSSKQST